MKKLLSHRRANDEGFTLIELMVVVLIIAILLAIAIPTFLGAQSKAKDRSAQSSVRNALTSAKTLYADTGTYTGSTAVALGAIEPAFTFLAAPVSSTGPKSVSVLTTDTAWYGAVLSDTKVCYFVQDSITPGSATSGTTFAKASDSSATTCIATTTALDATVVYTQGGWG